VVAAYREEGDIAALSLVPGVAAITGTGREGGKPATITLMMKSLAHRLELPDWSCPHKYLVSAKPWMTCKIGVGRR